MDEFTIVDVPKDNKCFYTACVIGLISRTEDSMLQTIGPEKLIRKRVFHTKPIYSRISTKSPEFIAKCAELLEIRVNNWINRNRNAIYEQVGLTIDDIIQMTHEISLDEYVHRTLNDDPIWGGFAEQIAISALYNIDVCIFNKQGSNRRFDLIQHIRWEPLPVYTHGLSTIHLLWDQDLEYGEDHYKALIPTTSV
jgi:hypothetical protein